MDAISDAGRMDRIQPKTIFFDFEKKFFFNSFKYLPKEN